MQSTSLLRLPRIVEIASPCLTWPPNPTAADATCMAAPQDLRPTPRRRDAEANRQRILDVATGVLAARPEASIDDIARAAGLVRRTFYGHFATRDDLIASMCEDSISKLLDVMNAARAGDESPATAYARFIIGAWQMAEQLRLRLMVGRSQLGVPGVFAAMTPVNVQVAELAAGAQADGSFDNHLPPAALATVLQAANFALIDALNNKYWNGDPYIAARACLSAGGMDRREVATLVEKIKTNTP